MKFIQERLERSAAEAKLSQLQLETIDVAEIIDQVMRVNQASAHAKQQRLTYSGTLDGLPAVRADFHALGQVLGNFISNAIKFRRQVRV
ncbi:MAG: hypothetical protein QM760_13060 [Nibricoccus sp.]